VAARRLDYAAGGTRIRFCLAARDADRNCDRESDFCANFVVSTQLFLPEHVDKFRLFSKSFSRSFLLNFKHATRVPRRHSFLAKRGQKPSPAASRGRDDSRLTGCGAKDLSTGSEMPSDRANHQIDPAKGCLGGFRQIGGQGHGHAGRLA
jgi:hypothetical protein